MFLKNYRKHPPTLLTLFAVFGLVIIVLWTANSVVAQTNKGTYLDFTGDGKTDWVTISPLTDSPGQPFRWKVLGNQTNSTPGAAFIRIFDYGSITDTILAGDYTGDRKTDLTVYRPGSQSIFYVAQFPTGTGGVTLERAVPWGTQSDGSFAQGDYDGDGKLDYTVTRRNDTGGLTWYMLGSNGNIMRAVNFGFSLGFNINTVLPGADFTGDGKDELVFTADVNGSLTYYIGDAITGGLVLVRQWGYSDASLIDRNLPPADYTGDGKADFVAVRKNVNPMVWYILNPANNTSTATRFGFGLVNSGDKPDQPIRGDYDGDGRQDIAVYRTSNHTFYVLRSSDGGIITQTWGEDGDSALNIPYFVIFVNA
ncbi:MAG: FG-GAP repeat domain-containing protein [Pyrinomonadaceae bacterium]